ncbi:MATE family efflux transporter [Hymenobacter aerilatus]|uniref:Multidrug-efflux transporter n=1 Tax=Hymenobacter aerilatus TaxID=2932251 RepID=A0A8T9SV13_9BACT|nr:MATE family efflux transporter [Hymenobacter aerilatus]UOR03616.1 MATE family efflux transporter [Hymenobacter aerilatus]
MPLTALRPHIKPTLLLAYPVVLSQLGHVLVNVCDSVMVGHIEPPALAATSLAAISLGVSTSTVGLVLGLGVSLGITPLVAAANGRRDVPALGRLLVNGVWLCLAAGLVLALLGFALTPLLRHLHQPAAVEALARPWIQVLFVSYVPLMLFQAFKQFAEGLGLTRQAMYLSIIANVVNAFLCYVLIFGHFRVEPMGMMGSAWATLTARVLMAVLMGAYVLRAARLQPYREAASAQFLPDAPTLRRLLGLGAPIGVQMMFEMGAFSFSAIMIGWLGATPLAAHQIAINVASVTYMAASGIAAAATIRVGNFYGLGDGPSARQAGFTAYWLTFVFMSTMGLILVAGRGFIPYLYNDTPLVVEQAAGLLLIAALFQVSDGLQVVGLGALRGLEDVKVPSVVALLAYWAVALPIGYGLGFGMGWGATGVWIGLLTGLTLVAGVLLWRFRQHSLQTPVAVNPERIVLAH